MRIIEARNISRSFDNNKVLSSLDLDVEKGEFLTISGRSGVGKSTLLGILGTHDLNYEGELRIGDKETGKLASSELALLRRKYLGFVFQDFHLLPSLTAIENVILPAVFSGSNLEDAHNQAKEVLDKLSIRISDTKTSLLSRGERQRVAVARGLVNKPSVLLADEPSASLDDESEQILFDLLDDLRRQQNFALIAVVHSTKILQRSDRILELKNGSLHEVI